MKFVAIPILIMLVMTQTFSKYFIMLEYELNKNFIATQLCENKTKPELKCHGKCQVMKKMQQEENQDQNAPNTIKSEIFQVISSRSFFVTFHCLPGTITKKPDHRFDSAKPVDRAFSVFHPPSD